MTSYLLTGGAAIALILLLTRGDKEADFVVEVCEKTFGPLNDLQRDMVRLIYKYNLKYNAQDDGQQLVYILATAWHESEFLPVRECFAKSDAEARNCVRYRSYGVVVNAHVYYGRGLVQLTWFDNYKKAEKALDIKGLAANPDLALVPDNAAKIIVYGMVHGLFTTRKLSDYITGSNNDYYNARRIVNGLDKAQLINYYTLNIITNSRLLKAV